jgi:hypothetical protein
MKSKSKLPENSVALAMAEIDRLQRDRANFASAKRAAGEQLGRQGRELGELRRRLLAERPHAWARRNREHARHRERLEHERGLHAARAEAEHRERLAGYAAELEDKRRQLAALHAAPVVVRPSRRMLEWAAPAVASVLVVFFAILAVGEDDAAARPSVSPAAPISELDVEPEAIVEAEPEVGPIAVAPEPEPVAVTPEPEAPTPADGKPSKPVAPKVPKSPKTPKNPNPLTLLDPNGDPLG